MGNLQKWADHADQYPDDTTPTIQKLKDWADEYKADIEGKDSEKALRELGFDPDYPPEA